MRRPIVGRFGIAAGLAALLPGLSFAQGRMAPLPPGCSLAGPVSAGTTLPARPLRPTALAVLPLIVGSGGSRVSFLAEGLSDAIAERIGQSVGRIEVVGRRAQRRRAAFDSTTTRAVGRELGVKYVLGGTLSGSGDAARISFALHDASTGARVWSHTFPYDNGESGAVERITAVEVASRIAGSLTARERQKLNRGVTPNRLAYEALLRGRSATGAGAYDHAADAFREAIRLGPGLATAYANLALADAGLLESGRERAEDGTLLMNEMQSSASRARSLDSSLTIAWLAEGRAKQLLGTSSAAWRPAFERALALDPRDPAVLETYSLALLQTDDRGRARELLQRAVELAPGRGRLTSELGRLALAEGRDEEACVFLNRAILEDPLYAPAWALRAMLRARNDDLRYAWADAETATRLGSVYLGESAAARVDLVARDTVRARQRLRTLWNDIRAGHAIGSGDGRALAIAFLAAREKARALDVLEAVRPRNPWYMAALRDASFDSVRDEPRFRQLVAEASRRVDARAGTEVGRPKSEAPEKQKVAPPPASSF